MSPRRLPTLVFPLVWFACTGDIDQAPIGPDVPAKNSARPSDRLPATNAPVTPPMGMNQAPPVTPDSAASGCEGAMVRLLPTRLWRLSPQQYVNSVSAVFGVEVPLSTVTGDGKSDAVQQPRGFDADALTNKVYGALGEAYKDNAKKVAAAVLARPEAVLACVKEANASQGCVEAFVKAYAEPAFRRPLGAAELSRFAAFYQANAIKYAPGEAARMVLEAVLQSPFFLYRTELGAGAGGEGPVKLTHHELAAQLSYLVADLPPSALPEVAQAARDGRMDQPAVVKTLAEALARTPQARHKLKTFFTYYIPYYREFLHADPVALKDPDRFPTFAGLKKAMEDETATFLDRVLQTRPTLDAIFTADRSYVNGALAAHYGLTDGPRGAELVETRMPNRAGLLGHAGVIAALSQVDSTSPVHRGLFYFQTLLCNSPGTPDPDLTSMVERLADPKDPGATERQKYEYFLKNEEPVCIGCHKLFHPMGLGLEMYDPIGRYRTRDNDRPLDTSVELLAAVAGGEAAGRYGDGLEAVAAILRSKKGRECFVSKYASYAYGVDVDEQGDQCAIRRVAGRFGAGEIDLVQLLVGLTQEPSFFHRQPAR